MTTRILFACLGNICRSPLAVGIMKQLAEDAGLSLEIDSAGVGSWHSGNPPDPRAIVAARSHGYEISDQRARAIGKMDFQQFDLIIAMDNSVLTEIELIRPHGDETPVRLITSYLGHDEDVADPYYTGKFDPAIDLLERAISALIIQLDAEQ